MFSHLQRQVEIAFRNVLGKDLEVIKRTHEEIPHDKEDAEAQKQYRGKDRQKDPLLIILSADIFFVSRGKRDLSGNRAVLYIVEDRIALFDELVVFGLVLGFRAEHDPAVILIFQDLRSRS